MIFAAWCRSLLVSGFVAALAISVPASLKAEVVSNKTISYFSIRGKTAADLDRELLRNGPMLKSTGARHPGATRIKFGGDVTYVEKDGRCRIGGVKVTVTTRILLPAWKNRKGASPQLGFIWDTLSSDIRRHEERHAEIARNHARSMEQAIRALRPRSTCSELQDQVSEISMKEIEAHDADQQRFDRIESVNFQSRLVRLLKTRLSARNGGN